MAVSSTNAATATSVLDVQSIVSGLMQVESQPLAKLDTKISAVNTKVSAMGSFMSKVSALQTALEKLSDPIQFSTLNTSSSNSNLVTVAANQGAAAGSLAVQVKQSALPQQTLVSGFSSATARVSPDAAGSFNLTNSATGVVVGVPVTATMTLTDLAAAVTASNAGVTAAVVQQTDSSYALLLTSNSVGAAKAFNTNFTPTDGAEGVLAGSTVSTPQSASDAAIRVNGIDYSRAGNTFANILPGVTLTLQQPVSAADWTSASTATVSVTNSNANAATAIGGLVTAYNDAYTLYRSLTRSNQDATLRGPLSGDQTLSKFMERVRNLIDAGVKDNAGHTVHLYDAGVTTASDGTLKVNSSKLNTALSGTLGTILANGAHVGSTTRANGLNQFVSDARLAGGILANSNTTNQALITAYNDQKSALSARLVDMRARYTAQYAKLDALLTGMQQTSTALTGALTALSASTKSD
jgi:flagellar hook-associated protein 2